MMVSEQEPLNQLINQDLTQTDGGYAQEFDSLIDLVKSKLSKCNT
jgi:hypothetical protein